MEAQIIKNLQGYTNKLKLYYMNFYIKNSRIVKVQSVLNQMVLGYNIDKETFVHESVKGYQEVTRAMADKICLHKIYADNKFSKKSRFILAVNFTSETTGAMEMLGVSERTYHRMKNQHLTNL